MDHTPAKIHSVVPVIATGDIDKTIDYYTAVLGFEFDFKYGEPPVYAGVRYGEAEIYFSHDPDLADAIKTENLVPEIFIWVTNAGTLFEEHKSKNAAIIEPVSDRPWGARQYVVKDLNGYHLKFAQPI